MSYLTPGPRSTGERKAIEHVGEMMREADEQREADELEREDHAAEDRQFDPASGTESPSTQRIVAEWNELREQRGGGDASEEDNAYLDDVRADGEARAGLPGDAPDTDAAAREAKAVQSVAKLMRPGVVQYNDDEEHDEDVPAVTAEDYSGYDDEILSDFPEEPARPAAPSNPRFADSDDDGYSGPHVIRRASEPPAFNPNG